MATALIVVEGVLRDKQGLPVPEGVRFLESLSWTYRIALSSKDSDDDALWTQIEGINSHQEIVEDTPGYLRGEDHLLSQVDHLLGRGQEVALVVTPDPAQAALVLHRGITALLFAHPKVARPEWRPDSPPHVARPWDQIVAEIEKQKLFEKGSS